MNISRATVRAWSGVATLLFAILVPLSAYAQKAGPTPKYFLLPTQGVRDTVSSIVPERIGELSREQIAKDSRVELMPSYEDLRKSLGGSTAAVAEAEALYTSGIGLLTAGEDQKAAETFARAVEMLEQNVADLANFEILADALANLALAYHNAGFDLDARKRMQAYAHLRPDASLDAEKFPKELVEIFTSEAAKVKKAGNGVLTITASAGEAIITIDGIDRGKTPLTVKDVGFGSHYLVARSADGKSWSEKIRVRGQGKTQSFKAELGGGTPAAATGGTAFYEELLAEIRSGSFTAPQIGAYLKELCAQTGAAHVGFVVMFKQGSSYVAAPFAYRAGDGMLVRGEDVQFNIELSNLLVGVSSLSNALVRDALTMPEDRAVAEVQIGGPPAVVASTTTETTSTTTAATTGQGSTETVEVRTIEPPPKAPPSQRNTWRYVGIAAGSLAVVGLVAGGIYLLADGDGGGGDGFKTEVLW